MAGTTDQAGMRPNGVWIAYYVEDYSDVVIFEEEIDALRHAVDRSMKVKFVQWDHSIKEEM